MDISQSIAHHDHFAIYNGCVDKGYSQVTKSSLQSCMNKWADLLDLDDNLKTEGWELVSNYWESLGEGCAF